jgi:hypothetical protein
MNDTMCILPLQGSLSCNPCKYTHRSPALAPVASALTHACPFFCVTSRVQSHNCPRRLLSTIDTAMTANSPRHSPSPGHAPSPPLTLPGFGLPLEKPYGDKKAFPAVIDVLRDGAYALPLTTLREFAMMELMDAITDKPGWERKVCVHSRSLFVANVTGLRRRDMCKMEDGSGSPNGRRQCRDCTWRGNDRENGGLGSC